MQLQTLDSLNVSLHMFCCGSLKPPSPSSTSCPPAFGGIFPPHAWPCVLHRSLCPPPGCTACSQTLPARRSEIELNSSLTPGRAPKQETRGISGEGQEGRGRVGSRSHLYGRGLPVFWRIKCIKVPVFTRGTPDRASKETFLSFHSSSATD